MIVHPNSTVEVSGVMKYFLGEYLQVMDSKNRIFIPSKYRDIVGDHLYITRNPDGHCLSLYSDEGWDEYSAEVMAMPKSESGDIKRSIFPYTMDAKPDAQGRVVLAQQLREYAGITKDIYIIGAGDHAEIWDKDSREAHMAAVEEAELLGVMQKHNF